jgi:protein-disulfide isomerase
LIGLAGVTALGVGASTLLQWAPPPTRRLTRTPVVAAVLDDPGSPRAGAVRPDVTVVVFTDYLCPICKATDGALARRLATDPGLAVIYKDWPIRGPLAEFAARTALAADRQGVYAPVHDALMAAPGRLDEAHISAIARAGGADPARLAADRPSRAIGVQLARHALQAFSLGLQGTPAYLVGPFLIEGGLDDRRLARLLARARRAGPLTA